MKCISFIILSLSFAFSSQAQNGFTAFKGGHVFDVAVPSYMTRITGLNSAAILQFKNAAKDIYTIIIEDEKEEMKLAELSFAGIDEFFEYTIKSFLKDEEQRSIGQPLRKTIGAFQYMETDASYFDKDANTSIYYLFGIVETGTRFYKVFSFTSLENKDQYKAVFQKILYSVHD